jgi:serine/threonine-protein kinase PRP4
MTYPTILGRGSASATPEPLVFDLTKEEDAGIAQTAVQHENVKEGTADQSAADYDPSMDQREDEQKRLRTDANLSVNEEAEEWEEEDDQDDEDVDDMFAIIDSEKPKKSKKKKAKVLVRDSISLRLMTNFSFRRRQLRLL